MTFFSNSKALANLLMISLSVVLACFTIPAAGNFYRDADINWGDGRGKIFEGGRMLTLSLDQYSGSGFQSKNEYSFGRFDTQLKLVPGNSAGTALFFYRLKELAMMKLTSSFLAMHLDCHTLFIPICIPKGKEIKNSNSISGSIRQQLSTPTQLCGILDASYDWATQGGRVKTDWRKAPFTVYYRNFNANGCVSGTSGRSCANSGAWQTQQLDAKGRNRLRWVQQHHMVYNYCADVQRFPQGFSEECKRSRF
ncbi:xyloglucan endotransglucosylase hydrolase 2-like [Olea europaea subsp. europaea]|uniref:Xyloglucan endotransglucosylase/hydrolase n=1 Tax=Olea europaea subsp. europaea TaxID=158383 RepID=A0A8S0PJ84_OLEEU|nr:xyloglucan endotransglucosylase hydrolase 2-like [Olea europaea subsp. europaea]